jgi:hypothetical protein
LHSRMRGFDRDLIRGKHYGPRSCESCTDQVCYAKILLANPEPSTHGTKRTSRRRDERPECLLLNQSGHERPEMLPCNLIPEPHSANRKILLAVPNVRFSAN